MVTLDLIGIFLVGVVVSLLSGTVISSESTLAKLLKALNSLGFEEGYIAIAILSITFFVAKGVASVFLTHLTTTYLGRLETRKASELFSAITTIDIESLEKYSKEQLLHAFTRSLNVIYSLSVNSASIILGEIALLLAVSVYLASIELMIFLAILFFFGLLGYLMHITLGRASARFANNAFSSHLKTQEIILGFIGNVRQATQKPNSDSFHAAFKYARGLTAKNNALYLTITTLPRYITEIAVMLGVGFLVLQRSTNSELTPSEIAIFLAGLFRIVASMLPLQSNLASIKSFHLEADLAFELMEELNSPMSISSKHVVSPVDDRYALEIRDLNFAHRNSKKPVLRDINLTVKPGSFIAITGPSGQGKSTLADLILGLREPTTGEIKIFGIPSKVSRFEPWPVVRYVPQDSVLIEGTITENILLEYSPLNVDEKSLERAIQISQLEDFLKSLPMGLETRLGSEGAQVSGGQRQRINLARALYRNPKLLILDEATSSLDAETDRLISDAILSIAGEVTIVAIAHRSSTIQMADEVFEVNGSRLLRIR